MAELVCEGLQRVMVFQDIEAEGKDMYEIIL